MKPFSGSLTVIFVLSLLGTAFAGQGKTEPSVRLGLDLVDGTHIIGIPASSSILVQTAYGRIPIPLEQVQTVKVRNDRKTVAVQMRCGDHLTGVLHLGRIEVKTIFGPVSVGVEHVKTMTVTKPLSPAVRAGKGRCAFSGDGTGTAKDPYQITTVLQLQEMRNHLSNTHFILMNDIDASATRRWNWDGTKYLGFEPVGMDYDGDGIEPHEAFTGGSLNGNGHVIKYLYINRPDQDWVGLFGFTAHSYICKIGLECPDVTGRDHVGTLSGHVTDQSRYRTVVHDAYAAGGEVRGNLRVGGLLGRLHDAAMADCYSTVKVTGNKTVGGLVGRVGFSEIRRCYASGAVTGSIGVGGLVGMSHATTFRKISVHDSFATGSVGNPTDDEKPLVDGFGGLIGYCTYDPAWGSPAASYNCGNNYYSDHADNPPVGVGNYPAIRSDIGRGVSSGGWTATPEKAIDKLLEKVQPQRKDRQGAVACGEAATTSSRGLAK
ncbi:MAG: GLUG motif-containing protein [Planctomycetota bacterium]